MRIIANSWLYKLAPSNIMLRIKKLHFLCRQPLGRVGKLVGLLVLSLFSAGAVSEGIEISELDATHFSLGMVGFAGKISEAEKLMVKIKNRKDASKIFYSIIEDKNRSGVAKLYALCGLKGVGSSLFDRALSDLENFDENIPVLRGDIMGKESFKRLAIQIKNGLC